MRGGASGGGLTTRSTLFFKRRKGESKKLELLLHIQNPEALPRLGTLLGTVITSGNTGSLRRLKLEDRRKSLILHHPFNDEKKQTVHLDHILVSLKRTVLFLGRVRATTALGKKGKVQTQGGTAETKVLAFDPCRSGRKVTCKARSLGLSWELQTGNTTLTTTFAR